MKPITADLPSDINNIEIVVLADYHYADPNSDKDAIKCDIDYILSKDNVYCVLAGDIMDCAIKTSLGDVYTNLSPMEELSVAQELLSPISQRILGVVGGNHEARHYKTNGVDMTRILARQLGIEDKYSPDTAVIFLRFGAEQVSGHKRKMCYTIYLAHGSGGGRKEGGKLQRLADLSSIVDTDIYIVGHTHLPASFRTSFARPFNANSSITFCDKLFVNAAAKLKYGGYGDIGGYKPNSTETPIILLDGRKKIMRAVV